jgi:uncharacterized protein YdeI (YjbR/CyaY-like superfamily)
VATFFETADAFSAWLKKHGAAKSELIVGYHKRGTQRGGMSWPQSVDAALCFGWIDGVRKRIDEHCYQIRFTPRKPLSIWSAVNVERVRTLKAEGRMREAGLKAYSHRREKKSKIYSYEQKKTAKLARSEATRFKKSKAAWKFFEAQPRGYRHLVLGESSVPSAPRRGNADWRRSLRHHKKSGVYNRALMRPKMPQTGTP